MLHKQKIEVHSETKKHLFRLAVRMGCDTFLLRLSATLQRKNFDPSLRLLFKKTNMDHHMLNEKKTRQRISVTGGSGKATHYARTGNRCTRTNMRPLRCWVRNFVEHTTSRLRHQARAVHGSNRNNAGIFTPWYMVSREAETEPFSPTCQTQTNTVWPVNEEPYWPSLGSSVCVRDMVCHDLFSSMWPCRRPAGSEYNGDTRCYKSLSRAALASNFCAQTAYRTTPLDCLTPAAVAKPCAVPENIILFPPDHKTTF